MAEEKVEAKTEEPKAEIKVEAEAPKEEAKAEAPKAEEKKAEAKPEAPEEKEKKPEKEERKAGVEQIFTIPLDKAKSVPRWKRSKKAVKVVKAHLARHLKADESKIHIDASINEEIWSRGSQKPPLQIRVKAMKFEDGVVEVELIKD